MGNKTHKGDVPQIEESDLDKYPSFTFASITFSDGTKIELEPTDVVVLVGPNNSGKSVALRELEEHIAGTSKAIVIKSVEPLKVGTQEEFGIFIDKHTQVKIEGINRIYSGVGFSWSGNDHPKIYWPNRIKRFRSLFCMRISTETRISASDPAALINFLEDPISHPIHMLYEDDQLEEKVSKYFRSAFGEDLILFRSGGSKIPLFVGDTPPLHAGEDRISKSYVKRVRDSTVPLHEQGDGMRSFASVILHTLAAITPSVLLLDEPEAFLHPPQARLLGEIIAKEKSSRAQLFVATHSPDVLHGLINVAPEHLHVLRIQRDGNVNRVKELDKEHVKQISVDPLMKYSSVLSGVFHDRVIICESDSDCMFYSSILDIPEVHGERQPDVLFVHGNGKDRMAKLTKTLVDLDVPVDVIADIDILRVDDVFKRIIIALGGDWCSIQPVAHQVKNAIEQNKSRLTVDEIKNTIMEIFKNEPSGDELTREKRSEIEKIFRKDTSWDTIKHAGESAIPAGQATQKFQKLQRLCKQMGLWIPPVGELEGFCKAVGGHGPAWVQQVIEHRDLAMDPDLDQARKFVREIWIAKDQGSTP